MCEKARVEKTILEAQKAVTEARKMVAQAKERLNEPLKEKVYLGNGKITKYGRLYIPKEFFEQTGLPREVSIPVEIFMKQNQLIISFPKRVTFLKEDA